MKKLYKKYIHNKLLGTTVNNIYMVKMLQLNSRTSVIAQLTIDNATHQVMVDLRFKLWNQNSVSAILTVNFTSLKVNLALF